MSHVAKFTISCGSLVKNAIIREIRKVAFDNDAAEEIEDNVGWIDGYLHVTLTGEKEKVARLAEYIRNPKNWYGWYGL